MGNTNLCSIDLNMTLLFENLLKSNCPMAEQERYFLSFLIKRPDLIRKIHLVPEFSHQEYDQVISIDFTQENGSFRYSEDGKTTFMAQAALDRISDRDFNVFMLKLTVSDDVSEDILRGLEESVSPMVVYFENKSNLTFEDLLLLDELDNSLRKNYIEYKIDESLDLRNEDDFKFWCNMLTT